MPAGTSSIPPRDSRLGLLLADRYRIDRLLDGGAMGRVYVGEHVLMHKRVAIKVLHRELTQVPEFVARFEREARAAANIASDHVTAATDFGKLPDGAVFLVLEFIEGKNLRDEIDQGPMPTARALHIARQIAEALRAAHALGIVHRDLKPENVMLVDKHGDPDFVKVLDFGIAKVPIGEPRSEEPSSRPITKAGMVFGTPEYMAPEQALGQDVDARADLYALGIILYEMIAGVRPFTASTTVGILGRQLSSPAPPIAERAPGVTVPPGVEGTLQKLLEREAANRHQTAEELLHDLSVHLGYEPARRRIPTLRDGSQLEAPEQDDVATTRRTSLPAPPDGALRRAMMGLRARLPAPIRELPGPVLISAPAALLTMVVAFTVVALVREPGTSTTGAGPAASAAPAPGRSNAAPVPSGVGPMAPRAELDAAAAAGVGALTDLATRFPRDGTVRVALATAHVKQKEHAEAIAALAEALRIDPELRNDGQVASALWVLAQSKKAAAAAFELLGGPMRERGTSILKDLTTTAGVRDAVRAQARDTLAALQAGGPR